MTNRTIKKVWAAFSSDAWYDGGDSLIGLFHKEEDAKKACEAHNDGFSLEFNSDGQANNSASTYPDSYYVTELEIS